MNATIDKSAPTMKLADTCSRAAGVRRGVVDHAPAQMLHRRGAGAKLRETQQQRGEQPNQAHHALGPISVSSTSSLLRRRGVVLSCANEIADEIHTQRPARTQVVEYPRLCTATAAVRRSEVRGCQTARQIARVV